MTFRAPLAAPARVLARSLGRRARLRWAHQLLGGALLMPYFLLLTSLLPLVLPAASDPLSDLGTQFVAYGLSLPLVAVTGLLFPLVRTLETYAAQSLCAVPATALARGPAGSWAARRRTAGWFALHLGTGALVSGVSLAVPPMATVLLLVPFVPALRAPRWWEPWTSLLAGPWLWTAPLIGAALLAGTVAAAYGAGALCARWAPVLLGPTPADRLAAAEERAAVLAARNRLARELHDSVGHALSAVTLQAGAARRVLDTDPDFAREALHAIEETAREAVAELDSVLGVLREEHTDGDGHTGSGGEAGPSGGSPRPATGGRRPAPVLGDGLGGLLQRVRTAGVPVERTGADDGVLRALPPHTAREGYRITQEGLSNVLRHAPGQRAHVHLSVGARELRVTVTNAPSATPPYGTRAPAPPRAGQAAGGGGRGLRGIAERAVLLGGSAEAGPYEGGWRLTARLPLGGDEGSGAGDGTTAGGTGP
ncbi:sensor histidine kinase [Streptomyces phytohabitans]|uniref:sensor histidine kinase n=1 Tax=Streptomyces phytohabitans TaxID=1150371 RepID=UPI00345C4FA3